MLSAREKLHLIQGKPSLKLLIERCPKLWEETGGEINRRLTTGGPGGLNAWIKQLEAAASAWNAPLRSSKGNLGVVDRAFPDLIRYRMAFLALQNYYLAALSGQSGGTIRFNRWNGTLLQGLLFRRGFERKPVNMLRYRLTWPLITQKKILMRLVYKKGIYCFYSARLIKALARLAREASPAGSTVLEIAAGDGTLARFLRARGCPCLASDDLSWEATAAAARDLPEDHLVKLDAAAAVQRYNPAVVLCSWPPAGNSFEKAVFANPNVRLYVVVGSRHQYASGNWGTYAEWADPLSPPEGSPAAVSGKPFTVELDEQLSSLVLPRELDNAVLVFRRRSLS